MWTLSHITENEFDEIYKGTSAMEIKHLFKREPESDEDVIANFAVSKLWRLNSGFYVISNKDGDEVFFEMNRAQHIVYSNSLKHARLIVLKSRQQGISTLWLISFFDDAMFYDNFSIGLMAQDKEAAATLLERVDRAWRNFPDVLKSFLGLDRITDNKSELGFTNDSKIYIRTSFRSGTLQRLHISEFGKIANIYPKKAKETKSGSLQTIKIGNTVIVESTAEGSKNMFAAMWNTAVNVVGNRSPKDFLPVFLSWVDDPDCAIDVKQIIGREDQEYIDKVESELEITLTDRQKWWVVAQRRELGEDFDQEYPYCPEAAFAQARDGSFYGKQMVELRRAGRIIPDLYDPILPVYVTMDLGYNDTMSLGYWQVDLTGASPSVRLIDGYHNHGEAIAHYVNQMKGTRYKIQKVFVPHDAKKKELGSGKNIFERLRELGVRAKVLAKGSARTGDGRMHGIEQVRKMIPYLWIDAERCQYELDALENYSKVWDEREGVWKKEPKHDEYSNPADMIRYFAVSRVFKVSESDEQVISRKKKRSTNVVDGVAI